MLSLPLGGVVKVLATWVLVGSPSIGIYGAPLGTIISYVCIVAFNIWFMRRRQRTAFSPRT